LESAAGTLEPVTLELGGNNSRAVADADPGKIALFGSMALVPVSWKPERHGLASTLFEILSFQPVRMRTQVLARKASYDFFRLVGNQTYDMAQTSTAASAALLPEIEDRRQFLYRRSSVGAEQPIDREVSGTDSGDS
jgi:hypothetical protein